MLVIKVKERGKNATCRMKVNCIGKRVLVADIIAALGGLEELMRQDLPEMKMEQLLEIARRANDGAQIDLDAVMPKKGGDTCAAE